MELSCRRKDFRYLYAFHVVVDCVWDKEVGRDEEREKGGATAEKLNTGSNT